MEVKQTDNNSGKTFFSGINDGHSTEEWEITRGKQAWNKWTEWKIQTFCAFTPLWSLYSTRGQKQHGRPDDTDSSRSALQCSKKTQPPPRRLLSPPLLLSHAFLTLSFNQTGLIQRAFSVFELSFISSSFVFYTFDSVPRQQTVHTNINRLMGFFFSDLKNKQTIDWRI